MNIFSILLIVLVFKFPHLNVYYFLFHWESSNVIAKEQPLEHFFFT